MGTLVASLGNNKQQPLAGRRERRMVVPILEKFLGSIREAFVKKDVNDIPLTEKEEDKAGVVGEEKRERWMDCYVPYGQYDTDVKEMTEEKKKGDKMAVVVGDVVEGKGWKDNYVAFQEDPAKTAEEVEPAVKEE